MIYNGLAVFASPLFFVPAGRFVAGLPGLGGGGAARAEKEFNHMKYDTLNHRTLSDFCLEVSTLLHAGVSVADGLHLLADGEADQRLKELYTDLARQVDEGRSCAAAMADTGAFPTYLCGLVEVGER